jgi:hypothetical protein
MVMVMMQDYFSVFRTLFAGILNGTEKLKCIKLQS